MNIFLFLIIQRTICQTRHKSILNTRTVDYECNANSLKSGRRPLFLRVYDFDESISQTEYEQWDAAAKIFPQVDFVSVDCRYNNGICNLDIFYSSKDYSQYAYIPGSESSVKSIRRFTSNRDNGLPQKFIDTIFYYDNIYPIAPPVLKLYPFTTESFYKNTDHPIFLFYDSSKTEHYPFINAWTKAANEEIYPTGNHYNVGLLDCYLFPNECTRWLNSTSISLPTAYIYSKSTGNYEIYNSYSSPIKYDTIQGLMQNADLFPEKPMPTAFPEPGSDTKPPSGFVNITAEKGFVLLNNPYLQERTIDQVKAIYAAVNLPPASGCENGCGGSHQNEYSCDEVQPSTEDHRNTLNLLNVFRWLAGLPFFVKEDQNWSDECQKTALNVHSIGYIPYQNVIDSIYQSSSYCGSSETAQTSERSLLISDTTDCFNSTLEYFKNDPSTDVTNRRWLLKADLEKVGLGYYPEKKLYYESRIKPAINALKVSSYDSIFYANYITNVTNNLDFVSWPPAGFFPLSQLPKFWHITHPSFYSTSLTNLDVTVFRDDGSELLVSNKNIDKTRNDQATLILQMSDSAMKLCQEFRTISVSVKNLYTKEHILYSFELFNESSITDICFYNDDEDECPAKVRGNNRYGPGNYHQEFFKSSDNAIRIYVAQKIKLESSLTISNSQKVFFLGSTIEGMIRITQGVVLEFQNPSETDIVVEWDLNESISGEMNSRISPKSYSIDFSENVESSNTITASKRFVFPGGSVPISISKPIIRGSERDVYYSFLEENGDCYLETFVLRSYDSLTTNSNYNYNGFYLYDTYKELGHHRSNKRIIRIYSGYSLYIYSDIFIHETRKRDYEFYSKGRGYDLYCDLNISLYANSVSFYGFDSSIYTKKDVSFCLHPMKNINYPQNKCEIPNVTIDAYQISNDGIYFPSVLGNNVAKSYYPDNFIEKYYVSSSEVRTENYNLKEDCVIETTSSYSHYQIYINVRNSNRFESVTIQPQTGTEKSSYTFDLLDSEYPSSTIPSISSNMPSLYFENYDKLEITNRLFYQSSSATVMNTFHHFFNFTNCKKVTFKNQPTLYTENVVVTDHYYINGGNETTIDFGAPTVFEEMTIILPGRYSFLNTLFHKIYSSSKQQFVDMKIRDSITINSSSLELINCLLLDRVITIEIIKTNDWPLLILTSTIFKPSSIKINLNIDSSKLSSSDDSEYERHILIYGFLNGTNNRCDSVIGKASLSNQGNYELRCSDDSTYMYVEKVEKPRKRNKKLSGGIIALIVIVCVGFVGVIIFLICRYCCDCCDCC